MTPTLTPEQYAIERAICDKAQAYWKAHATVSRGGWSSLSKEAAEHPDYAACDNAMRGRVEQYEILRDLPERLSAYVGQQEGGSQHSFAVTTWTGDRLGSCTMVPVLSARRGRYGSGGSECMVYAIISGREYVGRGNGPGMHVNLKETARSKRNRKA